ncbi:MAG: hypothetical protein M1426_01205 [Patescibacteria group bacterium]|nr:hypothetical protein [Patescibacteria group bacterium]
MIPQFEEKVIEKKERTLIVQDWKGNICEISSEFDPTYLRFPKDFVTRRWISCPVKNWTDWELIKSRYKAEDPDRIPDNIADLGKQTENRDYVIGITFSGPFWQMREWLGAEDLCMLFIDDPALVRDMVKFWADYLSRLLERILPYVTMDFVHISEDIAYKQHAMISPEMVREFLQPSYRQWNEIIKSNRCPVYMMDSDGYIGELLPIWIESGINACDPVEVAAGNDINEFRSVFGNKIAFLGGIDKRAIAKGGSIIRDEMVRLEPVVRNGGFIPGCDHGIPSDVGWNEFVEYCEILARITGWK